MAFFCLAYSFCSYVVPEQLTMYESAKAPEALIICLVVVLFDIPVMYTTFSYAVFRGKATQMRYDRSPKSVHMGNQKAFPLA